jgi:Animal haem peroxidase
MTDMEDRRRTSSSHQIDLGQLYGLHRVETHALRTMSEERELRGRLKWVTDANGEIYAPKLYGPNGEKKTEFKSLPDPILFGQFLEQQTPQRAAQVRADIFAFGGERTNTTPFTAMVNTLFLREHNRLADILAEANPTWDDERVFQTARNINIVQLIKIVIEDYINHISGYLFKFTAEPSVAWKARWNRPNWITGEFNLIYRWHSMVPNEFVIEGQHVPAENTLYDNSYLLNVGLARLAASASLDRARELGLLNTAPVLMKMRLERQSMKQCRENGIATYNDYRERFRFPRVTKFNQITGNPKKLLALSSQYSHPDEIEFYVGLLAEDPLPGVAVPPLMGRMIGVDAFSHAFTNPLLCENIWKDEKTRTSTFSAEGLHCIKNTHSLRDIVNRNLAPKQQPVAVSMTWPPRPVAP